MQAQQARNEAHAGRVLWAGQGLLTSAGFDPMRPEGPVCNEAHSFAAPRRFSAEPYRCRFVAESQFTGSELDASEICARAALRRAGLKSSDVDALFVGTSGDHAMIQRFWPQYWREGDELVPEADLKQSVPGTFVSSLAERLEIVGEHLAFTNGCVASAVALGHAFELIRAGEAHVCLCGGASLVGEEFFAKFDSGRALSKSGVVRAFSSGRDGVLLGDGVGFIVLESEAHAHARGHFPGLELAGWGMRSDAHHACQPHPEGLGMAAAINAALKRAVVSFEDVDYVNAHGTGTKLNDMSEARALAHCFAHRTESLPVSSTKTYTGHTLQAAGAVEAILTALAIEHARLPVNAGFLEDDPDCPLNIVKVARHAAINCALSLNSAFGGLNTALLLRKTTDPQM